MGFRLTITEIEVDVSFGDDHKLYGYVGYDEIKESFSVLIPEIRKQWIDDHDTIELLSDKDIYEIYFCMCNSTDALELDPILFSIWAKRYLEDFRRLKGHNDNFEKYIEHLINSPCKKKLEWY